MRPRPATRRPLSVRTLTIVVFIAVLHSMTTGAPVMAADAADVYFPNTEVLGINEMRVIALGTGTPNFRRSQASPAWLVELGNGEKFIFDIGTGSLANIAALEIPFAYLDKIFLSHLHVDHIGDLGAMFIGGWVSNRTGPLRVWGPGGKHPDLGTKHTIDHLLEMYNWDLTSRKGNMPSGGAHIEVTEFDYSKTHVIYADKGVTIKTWPAVHTIDGPVSYSLEWNDLKFVYSGDTYPNKWFLNEARDADILIHECYFTVQQLIELKNYDPERARIVSTVLHTPPAACGKLFAQLEPRMAIAFHNFNDFNTAPEIISAIRSTYDGPLTLADDLLVWNVRPDTILVRQAIGVDAAWPAKPPVPAGLPDPSERTEPSDWLKNGRVNLLN